MVQSKRR